VILLFLATFEFNIQSHFCRALNEKR
jgi:hypothetical protein